MEDKKAYHVRKAQEAKNKKFAYIKALKESTPCADCGNNYPHYVMDFDHLGDDKVGNVSKMVTTRAWKLVLEEIEKCELVCSNCHRERSWKRTYAPVV